MLIAMRECVCQQVEANSESVAQPSNLIVPSHRKRLVSLPIYDGHLVNANRSRDIRLFQLFLKPRLSDKLSECGIGIAGCAE